MKIDLKREIDKSAITIFLDFNTTHPVTEKKGGGRGYKQRISKERGNPNKTNMYL